MWSLLDKPITHLNWVMLKEIWRTAKSASERARHNCWCSFVCMIVNRFVFRADEVQCSHVFEWVRVPMQRDATSNPLLQIGWESVQHVHIHAQEWEGLKSCGSGSATRIVVKLQWHGSYQGCYKSMLQIGAAHRNGSFMALLHQNLVRGFEWLL